MSIYRCRECGRLNRIHADHPQSPLPHCGQCKTDLDLSGAPQEVDGKALRRLIKNSPVPVLLDVWAPWCGPCRMVAPVLDEVGRQRKGNLLIVKLNSDNNPKTSASLQVGGIPLMVLFKDGQEKARQVGAMPRKALEDWLDPRLR